MTTFQHKPLIDSSKEIRLVNLQPGQKDDPIRVTLTHAPLDGGITFDALSYAWGDPNDTLPITIDGHPFQVTVNLESALRHLRFLDQPRVIWIDAICIHQTNIGERDQQVRRMGSVYANAKHVLVWLGPQDDDSDLALGNIVADMCDKIVDLEYLEYSMHPPVGEIESKRLLKALVALFSRHWWRRGWVNQEVTGPGRRRENVSFHCGHLHIPFDSVVLAMKNHLQRRWISRRMDAALHGWPRVNGDLWVELGSLLRGP